MVLCAHCAGADCGWLWLSLPTYCALSVRVPGGRGLSTADRAAVCCRTHREWDWIKVSAAAILVPVEVFPGEISIEIHQRRSLRPGRLQDASEHHLAHPGGQLRLALLTDYSCCWCLQDGAGLFGRFRCLFDPWGKCYFSDIFFIEPSIPLKMHTHHVNIRYLHIWCSRSLNLWFLPPNH